jgi:hypothetical protein
MTAARLIECKESAHELNLTAYSREMRAIGHGGVGVRAPILMGVPPSLFTPEMIG